MAWPPLMSNAQLIDHLMRSGAIRSDSVLTTMSKVDRGYYCDQNPYADVAQHIGFSATTSQPTVHAKALELLKDHLKPGRKVLDIGSGSGYLTACMGLMVAPTGRVVGVEHVPELAERSLANIEKNQPDLIWSGVVTVLNEDGRFGCPSEAPFDVIHVGASVRRLPKAFVDQLKAGGRMIIPIEETKSHGQWWAMIDKNSDGSVVVKRLMSVAFPPLANLNC